MPEPTNDTVAPDSVQTPALAGSIEKLTGRPELADAETPYAGPPTTAPDGGDEVKLIDWTLGEAASVPIENDCCTGGAGLNLLLPRWVALIVHVPSPMRWTLTPVTLQIPALSSSVPNSTGSPEVAFAITVYGGRGHGRRTEASRGS